MFNVDDPLLTMLLRFVATTDQSAEANEVFLQKQLKAIKRYLTQFPAHEQRDMVMEWIQQNAERYREDWDRRIVSSRTASLRCENCPLGGRRAAKHCEIHEQWLYLLRQYITGQVSSRIYVEYALDLLQHYKDEQKQRRVKNGESTVLLPKSKKKESNKRKKKKKGKKGKSEKSVESDDIS